jgi:hypothetical protein
MIFLACKRVAGAVVAAFALGSFFVLSAAGQATETATPDWSRWSFLIGEWIGEGSGQPGQGGGSFTFSLDVQKQIIVRRSHTDFPAAEGRPASAHDDLMIIYKKPGLPEKAIYFDNEGNIIEYVASLADDGNSVTFLSSWDFSAPIYRLTYTKAGAGALAVKFEMAAAGSPSDFKPYLEGRARKK